MYVYMYSRYVCMFTIGLHVGFVKAFAVGGMGENGLAYHSGNTNMLRVSAAAAALGLIRSTPSLKRLLSASANFVFDESRRNTSES